MDSHDKEEGSVKEKKSAPLLMGFIYGDREDCAAEESVGLSSELVSNESSGLGQPSPPPPPVLASSEHEQRRPGAFAIGGRRETGESSEEETDSSGYGEDNPPEEMPIPQHLPTPLVSAELVDEEAIQREREVYV